MNDGNTVAGYIPFDPISSDTPKEHEPMNPTDMNEAEMREFFAKVASAVVNASEQAKVIEAIRAQQVEDHARLHNLESLVSTHLQTIDALREAVRDVTAQRDEALAHQARYYQEVTAERDVARDERDSSLQTISDLQHKIRDLENEVIDLNDALINERETTIHELHTRIHELEAASKGAQQTIVDLQHTVYNAREELRTANREQDTLKDSLDRTRDRATELEAMVERYETQLDQVRKAIA